MCPLRSYHGVLGNCPVGRRAIGIATDICRYRFLSGQAFTPAARISFRVSDHTCKIDSVRNSSVRVVTRPSCYDAGFWSDLPNRRLMGLVAPNIAASNLTPEHWRS